jgi:hypothetical protein
MKNNMQKILYQKTSNYNDIIVTVVAKAQAHPKINNASLISVNVDVEYNGIKATCYHLTENYFSSDPIDTIDVGTNDCNINEICEASLFDGKRVAFLLSSIQTPKAFTYFLNDCGIYNNRADDDLVAIALKMYEKCLLS